MTGRAPIIVGVDPGGATTGIVARQGDRVLAACSILSADHPAVGAYLEEVVTAVVGYRDRFAAAGVAVEDAIPPNPHLGISNPAGIIEAAKVLGAVLAIVPDAVIVRPGRHGAPANNRRELLARYPAELVGARETKGTGALRHVRSAWDIAGAAGFEIRTRRKTR